jgi:hypothetical protein
MNIKEENMSDRRYDEKQEKQDEKDEKSRDEKWRRDPLGAMVWAGILIWVGLVLLAESLGFLPDGIEVWSLFFLGAGVLILLEVLIRLLVPSYRRPVLGSIILAIVFLGIGGSAIFERLQSGVLWALVIIGVGVLLLLRGLTGRRRE